MYNKSETFDGIEQSYTQIVNHFKYLDSFINRDVTNDARILKAENAFGLIRKSQLRSLYLYDSVKGSVTSYSIYLLYYTVLNAAV